MTVKALTFTGWFLGLATIAILPLDISLAQDSEENALVEGSNLGYTLRIFWRFFYWLAFFFSFLLVPFAMHYEVSGEFDERLKLRQSAMKVAMTYAKYAVLGVIFLVVLFCKGTFSDGGFSVRGFLMAMGSAFGLLQIIVFLGYGLVNVPR